jgi:hypothetical protein
MLQLVLIHPEIVAQLMDDRKADLLADSGLAGADRRQISGAAPRVNDATALQASGAVPCIGKLERRRFCQKLLAGFGSSTVPRLLRHPLP